MAILNRLLQLLELLEQSAELGEYLSTPTGMALAAGYLSYQSLVTSCDVSTAAIVASTAAVILYAAKTT